MLFSRHYITFISSLLLPYVALSAKLELQEVVHGHATLSQLGANSVAIEAENNTHLNWKEFSIGEGNSLQFFQPDSQSIVVNHVVGEFPSEIMGSLLANGRVFLINPQGIIIGRDSVIDTAAFVASTLSLNSDLTRDVEWSFEGESKAVVENYGTIKSREGDVVLLGYRVVNEGVVEASQGAACFGTGEKIVLKPLENRRLYIETAVDSSGTEEMGIDQKGEIIAHEIEMRCDGNLYALAINQEGHLSSFSYDEEKGEITLDTGGGRLEQKGEIEVPSGRVEIEGFDLWFEEESYVDVSHTESAGEIFIGGTKECTTSEYTFVEEGARFLADSYEVGDGGTISIWSNRNTLFSGFASCRGGERVGNGGFVEVSSHRGFGYFGSVDLRAMNGSVGTLLLDPIDITISTSSSSPAWSNPYEPTVNATANVTDIETALASADVTIDSSGGSAGNGDVTISNDITWSSGNTLFITASGSITVDGEVTTTSGSPIDFTATDTIHVNQDMSANGGDSSTRYILLKGATVNIGSSTQTNAVAVTTNTGDIYIEGTTAVNVVSSSSKATTLQAKDGLIFGGTTGGDSRIGSLSVLGNGKNVTVRSSSGDISLYGAGDINIDASGGGKVEFETYNWSDTALASGTGNITINTTSGSMFIRGGASNNDHAYISSGRGGAISITLSGDTSNLNMTNGTKRNCGAAIISQVGGDITVNIQGDLIVIANEGGGTSGVNQEDFSCGIMASYRQSASPDDSRSVGNVTVTARDISLRSGDADGDSVFNFAEITSGHLGGAGGAIVVNLGRNMTITGGNGLADGAFYLNTNFCGICTLNRNSSTAASDLSVTVNCSGGNITIAGGNGSNANGGIVTHHGGNVTVTGAGTITVTGGGSTTGVARGGIGAGYIGGSGNVNVSCQNLVINGGTAEPPATNAANYGAIEQYSGTGTVSVTATGSITLNPGSNQYCPAFIRTGSSSGDNDVTVTAGSIYLNGASSGSSSDHDASIYTNSGDIAITLDNTLVLTGGTGNSKAQIYTANTSTDSISIDAASGSPNASIALVGGSNSPAEIYTTNGAINIGSTTAIKDLSLTGGSGASAYSKIYSSTGGAVTANLSGDLTLTGGSGTTDSKAQIATGTSSGTGNITLTCKDLTLVGGSVSAASAEIIPSSSGGNLTGNISQNLKVNNASGVIGEARLLVQDSSSTLTLNAVSGSNGDILMGHASAQGSSLIETQGGTLSIGQTYPFNCLRMLGGSGTGASSQILTSTGGNLLIGVNSDYTLTGGTGSSTSVLIGCANSSGTGDLTITGRDMTLTGGGTSDTATVSGGSAGGDVSLTLTGDLTIGSASMSSAATLINNKTAGSLTVSCDDLVLRGSDTTGVMGSIQSTGATTITTTGSCQLTSGSVNSAKALIQQNSAAHPLTLSIGTNLLLTSASNTPAEIISSCSIIGTVGTNLTLTGTSQTSSKMQASNIIDLTTTNGAVSLSYGNLTNTEGVSTVKSGTSLSLTNGSSILNSGSGKALTLVVDNLYPTSPSLGAGGFTLSSDSSVSTTGGGSLKVYTARYSQNTISGLLNGSSNTTGSRLSDVNNQYSLYYPNGTYTAPYTIFYKESATGDANATTTTPLTTPQKDTAVQKATTDDSQGFYEIETIVHDFVNQLTPVVLEKETRLSRIRL